MKQFDRALLHLALIAVLAAPLTAQNRYVLEGATVIGAIWGRAIDDYVVVVEGKRITGVGRKNQVIIPPNTPVIDLKGKYIVPGLIDAHVHEEDAGDWPIYLSWGITSVNCMYEASDTALSREQWSRPSTVVAPSIHGTAPIFSTRGGWWEGEDFPVDSTVNRFPGTPAEARSAVQTLRGKGIRRITLMYDDMSWCRDPLPALKKMDPEIMGALLAEAQAQGLTSEVHAPLLKDARQALDSGMTALVNGIIDEPIDATTISEFASRQVYYMPTFSRYYFFADVDSFMAHALSDPLFVTSLDSSTVSTLRSAEYSQRYRDRYPNTEFVSSHLNTALRNTERMATNYVQIVLGTDMWALPGIGAHLEMEFMVQAGLTPMQALNSSTILSAEFLGILPQTGTIEPGKDADILILDADPLEDIRNTRAINMVIKKGTMYTPEGLRRSGRP